MSKSLAIDKNKKYSIGRLRFGDKVGKKLYLKLDEIYNILVKIGQKPAEAKKYTKNTRIKMRSVIAGFLPKTSNIRPKISTKRHLKVIITLSSRKLTRNQLRKKVGNKNLKFFFYIARKFGWRAIDETIIIIMALEKKRKEKGYFGLSFQNTLKYHCKKSPTLIIAKLEKIIKKRTIKDGKTKK